jgi:riboflavin kinase/FMN adenylyltransferase
MMNIGLNPTFGGEKINIEVNIFDFESDIYNQIIDVELVGKVRDEKKFNGIDELKKQLSEDKKESLDILNFNHVI